MTTPNNNPSSFSVNKSSDDDQEKQQLAITIYTNAFNRQRSTLAGFATCNSVEELHVVRDAFFLGMAHDLCPQEYADVATSIVIEERVATSVGSSNAMKQMIETARSSGKWDTLVEAVHSKAQDVDSDLDSIWKTLEDGRLQWIHAVNAGHPIKTILKDALQNDNAMDSMGDVSDAKMIWIYALAINIPELQKVANVWAKDVVKMENVRNPLLGYKSELWDPRKPEWYPIDIGVQTAAEKGGTTLQDAWNA